LKVRRESSVGWSFSRICSLSMRPGWMVLSVTPSLAMSHDRPLAHRCSAPLAAIAAFSPRGSIEPLILTMRPHWVVRIAGSSAVVSLRTAVKLSAKASSQTSAPESGVVGREPPAQFTRISTGPRAAIRSRSEALVTSAQGQ
jgi:hypothetical protein